MHGRAESVRVDVVEHEGADLASAGVPAGDRVQAVGTEARPAGAHRRDKNASIAEPGQDPSLPILGVAHAETEPTERGEGLSFVARDRRPGRPALGWVARGERHAAERPERHDRERRAEPRVPIRVRGDWEESCGSVDEAAEIPGAWGPGSQWSVAAYEAEREGDGRDRPVGRKELLS